MVKQQFVSLHTDHMRKQKIDSWLEE